MANNDVDESIEVNSISPPKSCRRDRPHLAASRLLSSLCEPSVSLCLCGAIFLSALMGTALAQGGKPVPAPAYKDVQAVMKARCVVCHNQQMLSNTVISGGLALDTYTAFKKGVGGDKGGHSVFVAGKADDSELIKRLVATSPTKMMPKGGPALPAAQIALFKKWVDAGAPGPAGEEAVASLGANTLPMPTLAGLQDVNWKTRIALAPDVLGKITPKNPMLALALKIGPLPPLTAVAFAPDGKHLALGGYRAVMLWELATGKPIAALTGLTGPVQALAFRPDGTQLAVGSGNPGVSGDVKIVDANTLKAVGPMLTGHADVVFGVAWNSKGTQLVTGSQDKTSRIWEWPTGKEKLVLKDHSDAVTKVCFAPDDKSVYTASLDHNARRFDVNDGKVLRVFTGHAEGITALAINLKGDRIVTAGPEPGLRWWNVDTGDVVSNQGGHGGAVNDIAFSKDGKLVASASADHTVRLWDGNSTGGMRGLDGANDWMYATALSPDDKFVAGVGADGIANIWEAQTGRLRVSIAAWPPSGKSPNIEYAVITPEGYFDASPGWAARLHPSVAGSDIPLPKLAGWVQTLRSPENVVKGWQGAALDPAKIEPPKPTVTPPVNPAPKSVTPTTAPPKPDAKTPVKGK